MSKKAEERGRGESHTCASSKRSRKLRGWKRVNKRVQKKEKKPRKAEKE